MLGNVIGLWIGLSFIGGISRRFKNHPANGLRVTLACVGCFGGAFLALLMYLMLVVMIDFPFEPTPWYDVEMMMGLVSIAFALVAGFVGLMFVPDLDANDAPPTGG